MDMSRVLTSGGWGELLTALTKVRAAYAGLRMPLRHVRTHAQMLTKCIGKLWRDGLGQG